MLHLRADIDRLYMRRRYGGRGLRNIEIPHNNAIYRVAYYRNKSQTDHIVQQYKHITKNKVTYKSVIKRAEKIDKKINVSNDNDPHSEPTPGQVKD